MQANGAVLSRSVDDLKFTNRDKKTANINKTIMTSISTIMGYLRQGSKPATKKRIKLKEKDHRGSHGGDASEKAPQKPPVSRPCVLLCGHVVRHMYLCSPASRVCLHFRLVGAFQETCTRVSERLTDRFRRKDFLTCGGLQVVVPDEDIFDDAGDYDLSMRAAQDVK